jgi:sporulation protein YlmC with PRC-barrel domain
MEFNADQLLDAEIYDVQGARIGTVTDVYVDEHTEEPEWLLLDTGFFGRGIHVPARRLVRHEGGYRLPYQKDVVTSSPEVDAGSEELGEVDERELYAYYGVPRRGEIAAGADSAAGGDLAPGDDPAVRPRDGGGVGPGAG